jgi:hypothetical protein
LSTVISPVLLNVVLHGMEDAAGVCYQRSGTDAAHAAPGPSLAGPDPGPKSLSSRDPRSDVAAQLTDNRLISSDEGQNGHAFVSENFLYGFKGAPAARQRRAPARAGIVSRRR